MDLQYYIGDGVQSGTVPFTEDDSACQPEKDNSS